MFSSCCSCCWLPYSFFACREIIIQLYLTVKKIKFDERPFKNNWLHHYLEFNSTILGFCVNYFYVSGFFHLLHQQREIMVNWYFLCNKNTVKISSPRKGHAMNIWYTRSSQRNLKCYGQTLFFIFAQHRDFKYSIEPSESVPRSIQNLCQGHKY